jgi:hypothetical protein
VVNEVPWHLPNIPALATEAGADRAQHMIIEGPAAEAEAEAEAATSAVTACALYSAYKMFGLWQFECSQTDTEALCGFGLI